MFPIFHPRPCVVTNLYGNWPTTSFRCHVPTLTHLSRLPRYVMEMVYRRPYIHVCLTRSNRNFKFCELSSLSCTLTRLADIGSTNVRLYFQNDSSLIIVFRRDAYAVSLLRSSTLRMKLQRAAGFTPVSPARVHHTVVVATQCGLILAAAQLTR